MGATRALYALGNLIREIEGGGILLERVGEDADPIEFLLADEIGQMLERLLGLAGKSHDERAAQRDTGNAFSDPIENLAQRRAGSLPAHRTQNFVIGMLQRHI